MGLSVPKIIQHQYHMNECGQRSDRTKIQGKSKAPEKKLSQRHSVHHKSYLDWPGIEYRCPMCVASD